MWSLSGQLLLLKYGLFQVEFMLLKVTISEKLTSGSGDADLPLAVNASMGPRVFRQTTRKEGLEGHSVVLKNEADGDVLEYAFFPVGRRLRK